MYFDTIPVPPLETNCYLIGDEASGWEPWWTPGGAPDRVLDMVRRSGLTPGHGPADPRPL